MKTRIISAIVLIPLLYIVYRGGLPLQIAGFAVGLLGVKEFYNAFSGMDIHPSFKLAALSALLLYGFYIFNVLDRYFDLWLFITVISTLIVTLFSKKSWVLDGAVTLLGIFYVTLFSIYTILLDGVTEYRYFIPMIFITALVTDTSAYFSGYFLGKNKLWPEISPKKTKEGAVGGVLGSVIVSTLVGYFVAPDLLIHFVILGFIGSVGGQIGDLIASAFKRKLDIKDYGNIIPGHGGVMDRFDSILVTGPLVYYYVILFIA
ncbi:MAG: phosphatidate cytidylyltransferase [Peptostreptococcales bacterium]